MRIEPWHLVVFTGVAWACMRSSKRQQESGNSLVSGVAEPLIRSPMSVTPVSSSRFDAARAAAAPDLYVFAHDTALLPIAMRAAARIERASGIKIHVNEYGTAPTARPIFGSDFLCASGTDGRTTEGGGIALARACRAPQEMVLVHELIHALGVGHLRLPQKGIMNEAKDAPLSTISKADLAALCAVRRCTKIRPEA